MKLPKTTTILLASLMLAIMGLAATSQAASPTPRVGPSPTAKPKTTPAPSPTPAAASAPAEAAPAAEETITGETTPTPFPSPPTSPSPVPQLYLTKVEPYTANGKNWIRYSYDVQNKMSYPAPMWAPAPGLPPCGSNTNSSRTWVDFFKQDGTRLYGFCALSKPEDLGGIWFALEEGVIPPSWIYIEINDRQTNTKYKSNISETTM
jgi:hypothetical protein